MANPQPDIFLKWSKELAKAKLKIRIPGVANQVFESIVFLTYGANPSCCYAQIEQKKICELTGLSTVAVSKSMKQLSEMNLVTKDGNYRPPTIGINKDYDSWIELPKKVTLKNGKGLREVPQNRVTKDGNQGLPKKVTKKKPTYYIKNRETSDTLYEFYKNLIKPLRKTRKAAIKNIAFYLQEFTEKQLKKSIENYNETAKESNPQFRKNPSNFFGRTGDSERYFEDYLPENYKTDKPPEPKITTAADVERMMDG